MRIGAAVKAVAVPANRPIASIGTRQAILRVAFGALLRHAGNISPIYFGPWAAQSREFSSNSSVFSKYDGLKASGSASIARRGFATEVGAQDKNKN